ncbi:MAG TPA: hypothetical protein VMV49_11445 [Candidatus Deferrimicrobium sp.]|nr:hypothetical protein [Candidatus Deferrimicrobium sp.]
MATQEIVTFAFIFELVGALFLMLIFYLVFKRYLERRRRATLYLAVAILTVGLGILISSLGRLVALMAGITPAYHGYQYTPFVWIPLALVFNVFGDVLFLLFANHIFFNASKKFTAIVIIVGAIIAAALMILIPTPVLIGGEPLQSYIDLFQMIWFGHALFTFFTGGLITYCALRDSRKDRPLVEKRGLQLISILGISLALTNIMFVIDEFLTPYFGGNFSAFYYLGWICAHTGIVMAYLGVVLPNWLRKRWE